MSEQDLQLPTYYISQIADELGSHGVDADAWLQNHGLNKYKVVQAEQSISYSVFESLIIEGLALAKQPALGLLVGKRLGVTAHGMLGYAVIASSCLRESIEIIARYLNTRTPLVRVDLKESKSRLEIQLHPCYPFEKIKIPFLESAVLVLYNMLMQITQDKAPIIAIDFPYPKPKYLTYYQQQFNLKLNFDRPVASISLVQSQLDSPLSMADKNSFEQAKQICEQELEKMQTQESLQSRIRKYLLSFENEFPSLIQVADHFHMSPRNLHRKLKNENCHYLEISKSVKEYRATHLLVNTSMTVQSIATTLGYSDIANFRKAFKQWTNRSPSDYRQCYLKPTD